MVDTFGKQSAISVLNRPVITLKAGPGQLELRILPILMLVVFLPILLRLGLWQLDRAAFRQQAMNEFERAAKSPAVHLEHESVLTSAPFVNVKLQGTVQWRTQYLLDNQVHNTVTGYEVLAPVLYAPGKVVLVSRGWVPALPPPLVQTPPASMQFDDMVTVEGLAVSVNRPASVIKDNSNVWPRIIQREDFDAIASELGAEVLPRVIQPHTLNWGYRKIWKPARRGPLVNYGYAAQWFGMAMLLTAGVFAMSWKRR
jgi:cytochrome oxidase assembly protein ShyY1